MHATSTFTVADWTPTESPDRVGDTAMITTAASVGLAYMTKTFEGDLAGSSVTWFVGALNEQSGAGTYIAMEAFDGALDGRKGAFNVAHAASTGGTDRYDEYVTVVPGSGTGELEGITGTGRIVIDDDATHHLELDYEVPGRD